MSKEIDKTAVVAAPSDAIVEIAKKIRKEFQLGENGQHTAAKDFSEKFFEELNVTKDELKRVDAAKATIIAGAGLALGDSGNEQFKKHKALTDVGFEFKFGNDNVALNYARESRGRNPRTGEETVRNGVLTAKYSTHAAGVNRGELRKVKDHLTSQYASILG